MAFEEVANVKPAIIIRGDPFGPGRELNFNHEVVAASSGGGKGIFFSDQEAQDIEKIKKSAARIQKTLWYSSTYGSKKRRVDHDMKIRLLNSLT